MKLVTNSGKSCRLSVVYLLFLVLNYLLALYSAAVKLVISLIGKVGIEAVGIGCLGLGDNVLGLFLFLLCLGLFKGEDRTVLIYLGSLAAVINGENACRLIFRLGNRSELRLFIGGNIVPEHNLK